MATARTTYQDGRGAEGAAPAGHTFVWVSLRDPSPEELRPSSTSSRCRGR